MTWRKRMVCLALCLLTALGAVWVQAEAAATDFSFSLAVADANNCRYYTGDPNSIGPNGKSWSNGRGSYANGTVKVTNSGSDSSIYLKEDSNYKKGQFLLLPFTMTVKVPARTSYTATFSYGGTMKRNAKGATWFIIELTDNTDNAAYNKTYSAKKDNTMATGSIMRGWENDNQTYTVPSGNIELSFDNQNGQTVKTFTKQYAIFVGNSESGSLLNSYHHQLETTFTLTAKNVTTAKTINFDPNGGTVSPTSQTVTVGKTYGDLLPTPTRTGGYTFDGWYTAKTGGTKITSSSTVTTSVGDTLYAHWYLTPAIPASYVHCKEEATLTYGDYTALGLRIDGQPKHTNSQEWYECDKDGNNGKLLTDKNGKPRGSVVLPTAGVHYYYAVAITTRTDNGLSARVKSNVAKVTVEKATPRWNGNPDATNIDIAKDPYLKASTLTGGDMRTSIYYDVGGDSSAVVPGHFEWVNGETKLTNRGKSYHKVRFVPDDTQNYNVVDIQYSVTVTAICSHIWGDWKVVKKPTCTANGQNKHTCTVCNEIEKKSVNALGHDWGAWTVSKAASCTEKGEEMRTCQRSSCAGKETRATEALGHDLIQHTAKVATCTEAGWEAYETCSRCDYTTKVEVPAKGHTEVTDAAVEATCTEKGKTAGKHCSVCNAVLEAQKDIPAKGHTEVIDAAVEPTCTKTGKTEGTHCSVCKTVLVAQTVIPAKGHTEVIDAAVAATCTKTGKTAGKHCSVCSAVLEAQKDVPAKGHNWGDWVITTPATENAEGVETRTCQRDANHTETRSIPKLGHTHSYTEKDAAEEYLAKAATCTEKAKYYYSCTCGEKDTTRTFESGTALGHDWGAWTVSKAASCTEDGKETHTCQRDDCTAKETRDVKALGHDLIQHTAKAATCTEAGWEAYETCSRCDYTTKVEIPAKGHKEVVDAAVEATCTEKGKTEGSHCSVCETVLVAQQEVAAKGHTEVIDAAVAATCTKAGKTAGKHCSVCETVLVAQTVIPAKGHTEVTDAAVEPTCTEKGKTEGKHCSVCETVLVAQQEVAAKGHNWGAWVVTTPATENAEGVETRTCQNDASHTETRAIPKLGHTHSYTEKDAAEEYLAKAATCTEKAKYYYSCTCGEKDTTRTFEPGMALGHDWGAWTVSKAASCTEKGEETRACQRDGCAAKETRDVKALGHDYAAGFTVDTPATCTAEGSKSKHCSHCDAKTGETVVPALGHDLIRHEAKAATCTEAGWKAHETCSRCDYTTKVEIDKLGHNWGAWTVTKAASCTKKGEEARTCQRDGCAGKETRAIEALGHTEVIDAAVAATCTEKGLTAGKHCAVCSEMLVRQTKTPALHHDWSHWNVTTPATAETEGEEIRTCQRDASHTESRAVPKLGHIHDWVEVSEVPATCIEIGEAAHYECEGCGHMALAEGAGVYMEITDETTLTIPVSDEDHVPDAAVQEKVVPATCTEKGSCDEAVYCKECGKELSRNTKILDVLGHDYSVKEHDENEHWNKCSRCASTDAKAPHEWNNGEETTKPTCMTPGVKTYTCTACGRTKAETLSALGHDIVSHEAKAATCTEAGWNAYVACSRCDYTTKVEIPATGHSWGEWIVTTPATTEAEGVETRTCQQDTNHFETRAIPKLTPQPPQPERPEDPIPAQHPVSRRFPAKTDSVTDEKTVKSSETGDVGVAIYALSALLSAGGAAWMGRQKKRGE